MNYLELLKKGESETVEFKKKVTTDFGAEMVALANAEGGHILVGVDDNGKIIGCDIKKSTEKISAILNNIFPPIKVKFDSFKINDSSILVVKVEKSKQLVTIGGVAYLRIGTTKRPLSIQEILSLEAEFTLLSVDGLPTFVEDTYIKKEYIELFKKKCEERNIKLHKNFLENLSIIRSNNKNHLTLAGLLMFTENPQEFYPHTYVRLKYGESDERISGPLWKIVDILEKKLTTIIPTEEIYVGFERKREWIFPMAAVREAIINALVHRNYGIYSETFIEVTPTKLILKNPGSFPPGSTPQDPKPVPRNPILYELMFRFGLIEREGRGIELIKNTCKQYNIEVKYELSRYFTTLTLDRTENLLDSVDKKILQYLKTKRSSSEIAEFIGMSKPATVSRLNRLKALKLIKTEGIGPKIKYYR